MIRRVVDRYTFTFPDGWSPLEHGRAKEITGQLAFELGPDDPFQPFFEEGLIRAIGASVASEHAVFMIEGWEAPYFVSELSWAKPDRRPAILRWFSPEPRPDPGVVPITNLEALADWGL